MPPRRMLPCLLLALTAVFALGCASGQDRERDSLVLELTIGSGMVTHIGVPPDGESLLIPSSADTRAWDLRKSAWSNATLPVLLSALSPDGKTLAQVWASHRPDDTRPPVLRLVDVHSGETLHTVPGHRGVAAAFSPDSSLLATGSRRGMVQIYSVKTGKVVHSITIGGRYFEAVAFSPDGKTLAAACCYGFSGRQEYAYLALWDVATWKLKHRLLTSRYGMDAIAFSQDGRWIAGSSMGGESDLGPGGTVHVWDTASGRELQTLRTKAGVLHLQVSPDGLQLVAAESGGYVEAWDTRTWQPQWTCRVGREHVNTIVYAQHGKVLAAGTAREPRHQHQMGVVVLLNPATGAVTQRFTVPDRRPAVLSLAVSPNGATASARCSDSKAYLWDLHRGALRGGPAAATQEPPAPAAPPAWLRQAGIPVTCAVVSPDGKTIATGGCDELVRLWNARDHTERAQFQANIIGVNAIAFTPDGRTIVTGGADGTLMLWSAKTQALKATLTLLPPKEASSQAWQWIAYTPANYYLGSSGIKPYIALITGDAPYLTEKYRGYFNRPDKVAEAIASD